MLPRSRRLPASPRVRWRPLIPWILAALALSACGAAGPRPPSKHAARDRILAALDARDGAAPLRIRYNPAPCACPAFEVRLAQRWVRASWPGVRSAPWTELAQRLASTSAPQWPITLSVRGQIEREVRRTRAGGYAVTIEVTELLTR